MKSKRNVPEVHHDIKSRIIFEEPEAEMLGGASITGLGRNRSYTGYKYEGSFREPTPQPLPTKRGTTSTNNSVDNPQKIHRNMNLTIEGIKKKYGFVSKPQMGAFDSIAQPTHQPVNPPPHKLQMPLKNLANTDRIREGNGNRMSMDMVKTNINDLKMKYQNKRTSLNGGIALSSDNENQSIILDKYKLEERIHRVEKEGKLHRVEKEDKLNRHLQQIKSKSYTPEVPMKVNPDCVLKKFPTPTISQQLTPNFSDQMKSRNSEWLQNLDRVQDRIRAVLQR